MKNERGEKKVTAYIHDIRDLKSTPKFVDIIGTEVGPIKHLVCNAGVHLKVEYRGKLLSVFKRHKRLRSLKCCPYLGGLGPKRSFRRKQAAVKAN